MIIRRDDKATWIGLESNREHLLFLLAIKTILGIPDEIINEHIQEAANRAEWDETEVILLGIDSASAKEFTQELVAKVLHASRDENSEQ